MSNGAALIIGAGDATGGAIARAFAREGLTACVTRRARNLDLLGELVADIEAAGGKARAFGVDAREEEATTALFNQIEAEVGPLEVCVFNIGANVRFGITETTARVYQKVWEMAAFSGFIAGREAARVMKPRGRGTILFTGATASIRGRDGFSAFAGAKHALRALAQSMARELGPSGIHVAHIVVDGAIDSQFIRDNLPGHMSWTSDRGTRRGEPGLVEPAGPGLLLHGPVARQLFDAYRTNVKQDVIA